MFTRSLQVNGINPRKYTGHFYDPQTALTYAEARYYDGRTERFLSEDPAFLIIGNPGKLKDKTGLEPEQYLADPQGMNSSPPTGR